MNTPTDDPGVENPETAWEPKFPLQPLDELDPQKFKPIIEQYDEWHKQEPVNGPLGLANGWYEVTPSMAQEWLRRNPPGANRKISFGTVKYYARQMKAGAWPKTGQPVIFDVNGVLKDAQHRLWACLMSGTAFPTFVVTDVPDHPRLFAYLDNGKVRSLADALQTAGYNGVSPTIKQILHIEYEFAGYTPSAKTQMPRLTPPEIIDMVEQLPNAVTAARLASSDWEEAVRVVGAKDVVGYAGMRILDLHGQEIADDFFGQIGFVNDPDPTEQAVKFRKLMAENAKKEKPMKKHQVLGNLIKVFNHWVSGQELPKRWAMQVNEDFPQFAPPSETVTAEAAE